MNELLAVLTPLALVDALGALPPTLAVLAYLLGRPRPYGASLAFLFGLFIPYYLIGVLAAFGLGEFIDAVADRIERWVKDPDTLDIALGMVIGVVLIGLGWKIRRPGRPPPEEDERGEISLMTASVFGFVMTALALPSALPYFAAVDQVLRADPDAMGKALAILYYNLIFFAPFLAIVLLRALFPRQAATMLEALGRFIDSWGRKIFVALLMVIGAILVVDGVGWFLGKPLIPVGVGPQ